ncbi:hypothetical protein AXG93_2520s1010 [Marchantia polymorpha subsp. ruderalis]|uniref:Uncharacterized protein n=1 Tax=Marchantia polymorpha subsp. ruderalis TaxID=1480154 RepID=A0A176W570_MARPO|nr:hypothetical protein AXG93_2520s1010 [Marchantia polymorpha subsp. ruderalis]
MEILTPVESKAFPLREVPQEEEEVVLAIEVNSDLEGKPCDSPQERRKRSKGRQDSQPRKKQRFNEAAVAEERLRRAAPIEMRSPDFWARSKMKAKRLILEKDSSTKSQRVAARGRFVQEVGPMVITAREKEVLMGKKPRITKEQPTHVKPQRASKKDKGKAVLIEEVPPRQNEVSLEGIWMKAPLSQLKRHASPRITVDSSPRPPSISFPLRITVPQLATVASSFRCTTSSASRLTSNLRSAQLLTRRHYLGPRPVTHCLHVGLIDAGVCILLPLLPVEIESHNGHRLRKIKHHVAELIVRSGRRHRRLAKKLESYLSRSREAVANLELELVCVLRRLGLELRLEGAATSDSAGVGPVRCSHRSR